MTRTTALSTVRRASSTYPQPLQAPAPVAFAPRLASGVHLTRITRFVGAIPIIFCLLLCGTTSAHGAIPVEGKIVSQKTGAPVTDAFVFLEPVAGNKHDRAPGIPTGTDGSFRATVSAPGSYHLQARDDSLAPLTQVVNVPGGGVRNLVLKMSSADLWLRVLNFDGTPDTHGSLHVTTFPHSSNGAGGPEDFDSAPQSGGLVRVFQPPYSVFRVDGFTTFLRNPEQGCARVETTGWPAIPPEVHLDKGIAIAGRVVGQHAEPVVGAAVRAVRDVNVNGILMQQEMDTTTGPDGAFRLSAVLPDDYVVAALIPGVGWRSRMVPALSDQTGVTLGPGDHSEISDG